MGEEDEILRKIDGYREAGLPVEGFHDIMTDEFISRGVLLYVLLLIPDNLPDRDEE